MQESSSIFSFKHCGCNFYFLDLPSSCPECQVQLNECQFEIPPVNLPSPFSRAQDNPCSIVLKPNRANGDFLTDYRNGDNLHVALTDSGGIVTEYDQTGIHRDRTEQWNRCIVVNFQRHESADLDVLCDPDWGDYWDWCIATTVRTNVWTTETYDEEDHNCFSFVLACIRALKQDPFSAKARDKVTFCQEYMLQKTSLASKFITMHRKIVNNGGILKLKAPDKT